MAKRPSAAATACGASRASARAPSGAIGCLAARAAGVSSGGGRDLDLRRPIYRGTAAYGHFGRVDLDLPWENTDRADALKAAAGL